MGCCVIGGVAVLGEGRELAVSGFSSWLGIVIGGWCWWYISDWSGVELVGWWSVGGGVGLVRVLRGEDTLSVQDLVCDGCRGVAVEGGFVGVVGGVWHCGWLLLWLCGRFWLSGRALVGWWWGWSVGGMSVVGLATGWLVGGLLEGVFVWCGWCA